MQKYARRMGAMAETAAVVKGLFGALNDPELISLGIGAPAKEALPVDILREISNDVLRTDTRGIEALQYGPTAGALDLRQIIVEQLLEPKGVHTDADHIMVTVGGLETISLTCELFIDPGDIILADPDGVIVIPRKDAAVILEDAKKFQAADEGKLAAAKDGTAKRGWVEKSLEEKGYEIIDGVYHP